MKKLLLVGLIFPGLLLAQMDKVHIGMQEAEFLKSYPEATKDIYLEDYWTKDDSLGGFKGESKWLEDVVRNSVIGFYTFTSLPVPGPSSTDPRADSSQVYKMQIELEKLRTEYNLLFGEAAQYYMVPCNQLSLDDGFAYMAQWYTTDGSIAIAIQSTTVASETEILLKQRKISAVPSYYISIWIESSVNYCHEKYGIGMKRDEFNDKFLKVNQKMSFTSVHSYRLTDVFLLDSYWKWEFRFEDSILTDLHFYCQDGADHGNERVKVVFAKYKERTRQLQSACANQFGLPELIKDSLPAQFVSKESPGRYTDSLFRATWRQDKGYYWLSFGEHGGGTMQYVQYFIRLEYVSDEELGK